MKGVLVGLFFGFFISLVPPSVYAIECSDSPPKEVDDLKSYIDACSQKISSLQGDQQTLKQAITTLNSKINLANAQINQTQIQITTLEKEVQVLSGVLDTVNESMDQLAKIYIARVRESYRRLRTNKLDLIFSSTSLGDYLMRQKFLNTLKARDQLFLSELEKSRLDYDAKKNAKIEKQKEVEKLKAKLVSQKKDLDSQQSQKQKLLVATQNDEAKYQILQKQAKQQLIAIQRYINSQGGASLLSNQTFCDGWGCYYSQRDSQWGKNIIGTSDMTLAEVGCLITSTAMVASHYGKDLKPNDIAGNTNPFWPNTAYMLKGSWSVNGVTLERTDVNISTSRIDEEVNAGRPVIVGLYAGPSHFIVIKGKNDQGYIMNDPFMENGHDKPFTDKYKISDISQLNIVRVY